MPDQSAAATPEPAGTQPEATERTGTEPDVDASAEGADTEDAPVFMNRAARRAHAQGTTPRRSASTSGQFGRKGTVQGPRQWGNRRSG